MLLVSEDNIILTVSIQITSYVINVVDPYLMGSSIKKGRARRSSLLRKANLIVTTLGPSFNRTSIIVIPSLTRLYLGRLLLLYVLMISWS